MASHLGDIPGTIATVAKAVAGTPLPGLVPDVPLGADSPILAGAVYAALAFGAIAAALLVTGFETLGALCYLLFLLAVTPIMHCASLRPDCRCSARRGARRGETAGNCEAGAACTARAVKACGDAAFPPRQACALPARDCSVPPSPNSSSRTRTCRAAQDDQEGRRQGRHWRGRPDPQEHCYYGRVPHLARRRRQARRQGAR